MKRFLICICIVLLSVPQMVIGQEKTNDQKIIREIKTFTIYEIPNDKDYLFVLDGVYNDISIIKKYETKPLRIKLTSSQKPKQFKPGTIVESISFREENPPEDVFIDYFDCDFAIMGEELVDAEIFGTLYAMNKDKNFYVIESKSEFYRVSFLEEIKTDSISIGDNLKIFGQSIINRPLIITSARFKNVADEENKRILKSCKMSAGGWHDGLFRVRTNNEYWQVNFDEDQPNKHLKRYMRFSIKGTRDNHLEQTLHDCVLLDIISKRNIAGKIVEVLPAHSLITIVDTKDWTHKAIINLPESELKKIEVGKSVRISGYQIDTRYDLPLLFSDIFIIDEDKVQPVSFQGEIYDCETCEKDRIITAFTGRYRWNILVPDNFDCSSIEMDDWVSISGSIQSYGSKLIKADTIKISKASLLVSIISNGKNEPEIMVSDLFSKRLWFVEPNKGSRSFFRRGDLYQVKGDLAEQSKNHKIINASFKKLNKTKGQITAIDSFNQQLTIKNTVDKMMIIDVSPEWYNIDIYEIGEWIEVTGIRSKFGLKDVIIKTIEKRTD